jgi:hypothetical protein
MAGLLARQLEQATVLLAAAEEGDSEARAKLLELVTVQLRYFALGSPALIGDALSR